MKEIEDVVDDINGNGKFQKRLLYVLLLPLYIFLALNSMMVFIILQSPPHWCNHPMASNLTGDALKEWKDCYIPKNNDSSFDACKIVLPNIPSRWEMTRNSNKNGGNYICPVRDYERYGNGADVVIEECKLSWMYDQSEFTRTIVTDLNWVCKDAQNVPNLHTIATVGGLLGGLLFSYLGDQFGRKYVFWCSVGILISSILIKTFLVTQYYVFVVFHALAAAVPLSIYQLPISIMSEISNDEFRSWGIMLSWMAW